MVKIHIRYIVYLILIVSVITYLVLRKSEPAKPTNERPVKPLFKPLPALPKTSQNTSREKEPDQVVPDQSLSEGIMDVKTLEKFKGKLTPAQIEAYKSKVIELLSQGKYSEGIELGAIILSRIEDAHLFEEFSVWLEKYEKQVAEDWREKNFGPEELRPIPSDQLILSFINAQTNSDAQDYYFALDTRKLSKSQIDSLTAYFWQTEDSLKKNWIISLLGRQDTDNMQIDFIKDVISRERSPMLRESALSTLYGRELKKEDLDFLRNIYDSDHELIVTERAFDILMKSGYKNKNDLIRQSLNSNDPLNRKLAVRQLGLSGDKEILLKATISDPSPLVREEAYVHLIHNFVIGNPILGYGRDRIRDDEQSVRVILHGMTNDTDEKVRLAIINSLDLNKLRSSRYKAEFEVALENLARNDPSEDVQQYAAEALQLMRHTDK